MKIEEKEEGKNASRDLEKVVLFWLLANENFFQVFTCLNQFFTLFSEAKPCKGARTDETKSTDLHRNLSVRSCAEGLCTCEGKKKQIETKKSIQAISRGPSQCSVSIKQSVVFRRQLFKNF